VDALELAEQLVSPLRQKYYSWREGKIPAFVGRREVWLRTLRACQTPQKTASRQDSYKPDHPRRNYGFCTQWKTKKNNITLKQPNA
jgi:hypothetical protein